MRVIKNYFLNARGLVVIVEAEASVTYCTTHNIIWLVSEKGFKHEQSLQIKKVTGVRVYFESVIDLSYS